MPIERVREPANRKRAPAVKVLDECFPFGEVGPRFEKGRLIEVWPLDFVVPPAANLSNNHRCFSGIVPFHNAQVVEHSLFTRCHRVGGLEKDFMHAIVLLPPEDIVCSLDLPETQETSFVPHRGSATKPILSANAHRG